MFFSEFIEKPSLSQPFPAPSCPIHTLLTLLPSRSIFHRHYPYVRI